MNIGAVTGLKEFKPARVELMELKSLNAESLLTLGVLLPFVLMDISFSFSVDRFLVSGCGSVGTNVGM